MAAISKKLRSAEDNRLLFWCPGCDSAHHVPTGGGAGPRWSWNGDVERPTFSPSLLVTWSEPTNLHDQEAMQRDLAEAKRRREAGELNVKVPQSAKVCHSFITDGRIQFLTDCTHPLAGQTVDIPDFDAP